MMMDELKTFLSANTVVRKLGATVVPMNTGPLTMPFIDTGSTAAYVAALIPASNDLLRDDGSSVDRIVRDDMVRAVTLKEDAIFIRIDGTPGAPLATWCMV